MPMENALQLLSIFISETMTTYNKKLVISKLLLSNRCFVTVKNMNKQLQDTSVPSISLSIILTTDQILVLQ
jgi:hypothetical protein